MKLPLEVTSALETIRLRLATITPGEWCSVLGSGDHLCTAIASDISGEEHSTFICDCLPDYVMPDGNGFTLPTDHVPNLKFIEHAPNDIAALLYLIDNLVAAIAEPQ
jgi:hypothetical protein